MSGPYPKIVYTEEAMREGMQIESADIPIKDKIELLDALSQTGLRNIVVGSFVSPKWTPQMTQIEEIVTKFKPKAGVKYTAVALNQRGVERTKQFVPPLTLTRGAGKPRLTLHQCDVFARRNTNRSHMEEMAAWPRIIATAKKNGDKEAGIGTNATFGSNFLGDFSADVTMKFLEKQHELWDAVDIKVTTVSVGDPMGWCHPEKVAEIFGRVKAKWPDVTEFRCHLHNARGMAITSAYAAIKTLEERDTIHLQGTLGGIGGCPYCGTGRATGMAPTEDFMHMLEGMGIETGVDMDKLIDCVWMVEKMIGRTAWGHVSRGGPRPMKREQLFDANAPFVETIEQSRHFKLGPEAYEGCLSPYTEPITSPYLDRIKKGLPAFDVNGDWPWEADFFPKPGKELKTVERP
jgi:hydroxymethylglutaryl-CoA lyase